MKIEVGKTYKTRGSRNVPTGRVIRQIHNGGNYKFLVELYDENGVCEFTTEYTANGHYWSNETKDSFDLVEEVPGANGKTTGAGWLVWRENGPSPTVKHPTEADARKEAERLASKTPGAEFHVIKIIASVKVAGVEWTEAHQ